MKQIEFIRPYRWAANGCNVLDYAPGLQAVPDRCAECAIADGAAKAAVESKATAPPRNKARRTPQNK